MNIAYTPFEEGFIKSAVDQGVDETLLRNHLKEAQDYQNVWMAYVKKAEEISGDPEFRVKLAGELIKAANPPSTPFSQLERRRQYLDASADLGEDLPNPFSDPFGPLGLSMPPKTVDLPDLKARFTPDGYPVRAFPVSSVKNALKLQQLPSQAFTANNKLRQLGQWVGTSADGKPSALGKFDAEHKGNATGLGGMLAGGGGGAVLGLLLSKVLGVHPLLGLLLGGLGGGALGRHFGVGAHKDPSAISAMDDPVKESNRAQLREVDDLASLQASEKAFDKRMKRRAVDPAPADPVTAPADPVAPSAPPVETTPVPAPAAPVPASPQTKRMVVTPAGPIPDPAPGQSIVPPGVSPVVSPQAPATNSPALPAAPPAPGSASATNEVNPVMAAAEQVKNIKQLQA